MVSAGELGFVASLSFRGTGPFELQYEVEKVGFREKVKRTKKFHHLQEQLVVQEKSEGTFMYRWLKVTDKNYPDGVPLVGERRIEDVEQVVHPLADAKLVDEGKRQVIWECRDKNVTFKVDLTAVSKGDDALSSPGSFWPPADRHVPLSFSISGQSAFHAQRPFSVAKVG